MLNLFQFINGQSSLIEKPMMIWAKRKDIFRFNRSATPVRNNVSVLDKPVESTNFATSCVELPGRTNNLSPLNLFLTLSGSRAKHGAEVYTSSVELFSTLLACFENSVGFISTGVVAESTFSRIVPLVGETFSALLALLDSFVKVFHKDILSWPITA